MPFYVWLICVLFAASIGLCVWSVLTYFFDEAQDVWNEDET